MNWSKRAFLSAVLAALGSVALAQDSEKEAIYIQAIKANPNNFTAHYNLGVTYLKEQKFELAIQEFQKCAQLDPSDKGSKTLLEICQGVVAMSKGTYAPAAEHFQNALKIDPENGDAKRLLNQCNSQVYMDQKNYPAAVTALTAVVKDDPKNFSAYQNLGFIYFQQKDYKKAVDYWTQAVRIKDDARFRKFLGFSYYNLGDFQNAIEHYKRSIALETQKDPKAQDTDSLDETYYDLGVAYNDNAAFDDAADAFGNAFKINPKDSNAAVAKVQAVDSATNAHMEKASNYLLSNQYADAINEWKQVLRFQPDNAQAKSFIEDASGKRDAEVNKHLSQGMSLLRKGNTVDGLNELNLVLKMDPENASAKKAIQSAKVNNNLKVKALVAEGDEFYNAKDYSDALISYLKALKLAPSNASVRKKVAKLKSSQSKDTKNVLEKAMKYYAKKDYLNAKKYLLVAQQLNSSDAAIKENLFRVQKDISNRVKELNDEGVALFNSGDKDKSKKAFAEVLQYKPNDDTANDYIKRMTGQQAQAKVDAEKVKALYYDGVNLYINGKIHEAIDKWKECLKQDPNNVNAQANINKAMVKLQSIEKLSQN